MYEMKKPMAGKSGSHILALDVAVCVGCVCRCMGLGGVSVLVSPSLRLPFFLCFPLSFSPLIKVRSPTKQISPHTTQHNTTQKQSKAQPAEQQCNLARTRRTSLVLSYLYRVVVVVVVVPHRIQLQPRTSKPNPTKKQFKKKVVRRKQYTGIKPHTHYFIPLSHTRSTTHPLIPHTTLHPPLRTAKRAPARQTRRVSARVSHCGTAASTRLRPTRAGQARARVRVCVNGAAGRMSGRAREREGRGVGVGGVAVAGVG
jgi:hypothetical protein